MPIMLGTTPLALAVGGDAVSRAYLGSTLVYEAAISAPLWQEGTPYEDELVFTYYDAAGNKLDEDRLFILNQLNGLTVEMETLRGSRSQIPQILNEP